ncbi:type VI secretion system-associated FHA domain protein [Sphingomonas sp. PAMC 26617]|uniref:type VI secretion system-associated FHA domain protein n=1 Tax=Sphingomonas sp. PAMC 26617 TaxID=1112216 RepID=UPI0002898707|nr:type VI secretion system-associated FHA domain protein [Sphingomonas sp. PAMC 26617]
MYMLQLFDAANELQPIDARLMRDGLIRIGRDSAADWTIADPDCELSRSHCELAVVADELRLRSLGANGVFDDTTGRRFPDATDVAVEIPSTIRFGRFRLKASRAPHGDDTVDAARTMVLTPPLGSSVAVPDDWSDGASFAGFGGESLLEAFCEGAGLDASLLSSEDPAEIMRRAGAVYRQMVLGVGDLMAERDRARGQYKLSRTTIGGANNNPFKWAPTQRLAIDLLLAGSGNFLSGPAALQVSFRDVKRHLIATFAGLHGSLRAAIDTFDPVALDAAVAPRASMLKSRTALQAEEVARRHGDLTGQLDQGSGGSLERAFVAAYDAAEAQSNSPSPAEPA